MSGNRSEAELQSLPYLTADLMGIGGRLKSTCDDFVVDEIPAYEPSGSGEHLFLWVEKRDVSAERLTQTLGRALGVSKRDIGVAGMKDRRAVTRQYVSVPAKAKHKLDDFVCEGVRILGSKPHGNKLRTGHLRGNRFRIVVRDPVSNAGDLVQPLTERLRAQGCPNYFGEQRFGFAGENVARGMELLRGELKPSALDHRRRRFLLRLLLSAAQSHLFNELLADRVRKGITDRVAIGDVLQVKSTGGVFRAEDVDREQARVSNGETAICGPIFGGAMLSSAGESAAQEAATLSTYGLTPDDFNRFPNLTQGTRRPYLLDVPDLRAEVDREGCVLTEMTLPPGGYATTVLREFMKVDVSGTRQQPSAEV